MVEAEIDLLQNEKLPRGRVKTKLEKMGPLLNSNSEVFKFKIEVPSISLGIKSGVN